MSATLPGSADDIDLSPAAIALLECTSDDRRAGPAAQGPLYITSKDAYLWAGIAYSIAKSNLDAVASGKPGPGGVVPPRRLEDIDILANLFAAAGKWRSDAKASYDKLPQLQFDTKAGPGSDIEQQNFLFAPLANTKAPVTLCVIRTFAFSLRHAGFLNM